MARRGSYYEMFTVQGKYYTQGTAAGEREEPSALTGSS